MKKVLIFFVGFLPFIFSCTDPVLIDLEKGKSQLVVDAIITDIPGDQLIKLRLSSAYLDNSASPPALDAEVYIIDALGRKFIFEDKSKNGNYYWRSSWSDTIPLGIPGNFYRLTIKYNGQVYESEAYMDFSPQIDSVKFDFNEEAVFGEDTIKAGYTASQIFTFDTLSNSYRQTRDLPGEGNCYWFKSYRNNVFFNKPSEINLAYDGAFGPGSDDIPFIPPIVFSMTPERLQIGDTLKVECWSIGIQTFYYLTLAQQQMLNGGLFATPSANVPGNIKNTNSQSAEEALGWFGAASVKTIKQVVKQ